MARSRSDRITELGELQLQVLDLLVRLGQGSVYEVLEAFPESERPRYTTVLTVLGSLEKRGLVTHTIRDRSYLFHPTERSEQVRRGLLVDVLNRVFAGSPQDLMAALLDVDAVTPEVLDELRALIETREAQADVDG